MKQTDRIEINEGYSIEWGWSSWAEDDFAIRNRYATKSGGFSPRSSSEMPIGDLEHLVVQSARRGHLTVAMMERMAVALVTAIAEKAGDG